MDMRRNIMKASPLGTYNAIAAKPRYALLRSFFGARGASPATTSGVTT